jgi:AcrR family transcriptional regulator
LNSIVAAGIKRKKHIREGAVRARNSRKPPKTLPDKFAKRQAELAEATLNTLAELGYARTSLRDIAKNSRFTHSVLHYYFSDKVDLITYCVREYKTRCIGRYDEITANARSYKQLVDQFATALGNTLTDDARMHRLWYDLRSQSLFEPTIRDDVNEIDEALEGMNWRVVSRAFELGGFEPTLSKEALYAAIDGMFQRALFRYFGGDAAAVPQMREQVRLFLASCRKEIKPVRVGSRPVTSQGRRRRVVETSSSASKKQRVGR